MLILGIDDSGRGPIIGPMILAGCLINNDIEKKFKELGVRDSKTLIPKKREYLAKIIKEKAIDYKVSVTYPEEIDGKTNSGINLNRIEAIKAAEIINKINFKLNEKIKVVVDCPSPNIEKWTNTLNSYVKDSSNLSISCEHKADKNHIAVSAASILAKSRREEEIEKIKKQIGKDFGSGYTSDPITQKFLEDYSHEHKKDGIFRETWATWKNLKGKKEQKKLMEF
ncbi:MAG: ribonuclease HII [Nanoarchaeota archaeon]|nr:ribonuclease HII [Nanoarchaeota archaeon]